MSREIAVADCETDPFKKGRTEINPFIWGFYNGEIYKEFTETSEFIAFVRAQDIILYAHNGGKFDWIFLAPFFDEFSELMIINGRLSKFKIGECEFRDSYNILPIPLSAYKKDEIDYALFEKEERVKRKNKKLISDYLRSDCIYLFQLVTHFINNYGTGLTLAGSAMKVWQKICDETAPRTSQSFYDHIKPFYYGGRVEVFEAGIIKKLFNVVDINSAYPFAMKHLHPYGNKFDILTELPKSESYIERCFITLSCISRGALPYREKSGLEFPIDDIARTYKITGWEYLAAVEVGALESVKIIEIIQFKDSIRFDKYIDRFYQLKNESERDSPDYITAKLFLNSLYGKFGADPSEYMEYMVANPQHIIASECDGYNYSTMLGDWALLQKPLDDEKQRYFNVAVAASITGFVRAYLFKAMRQCKGLIYCDTDSIAASDTGDLELSDTKLGAWKHEATCDWAAVSGKKLYLFHKKQGTYTKGGKFKKASKGARLSNLQLFRLAKDVPQLYEPIAPTFSIKTGIRLTNRRITKNAKIACK